MDFSEPASGARGFSRRLMAYHCSGSDTVLGAVNVGGSVVLLLLIGFVVGFGVAYFIFWRRQRRQMRLEMEYRTRFPEHARKEAPDMGPLVRSATAPIVPSATGGATLLGSEAKLPATAAALSTGPLAAAAALSAKQPPQRTSSGNPFQAGGVEAYNVVTNPAVASSLELQKSTGGNGLIPAAVAPTISLRESFARRTSEQQGGGWCAATEGGPVAAHNRSETMVVNPLGGGSLDAVDVAPAVAPSAQQQTTSDYLAAVARTSSGKQPPQRTSSGNPFTDTTNNPFTKAAPEQDSKQAQKQEMLAAVQGDAYDETDLDPEWAELLRELDARLVAAGKQSLNSKERAVAIRSLIVATASQSADVALSKAVQDVEVYRRAQAFRGAA